MSAITSTSDGGLVRYAFSCPSLSDAFEVTGFTGVERLNAPFRLTVHLVSVSDTTDTAELLGRDVSLTIERGDGHTRTFYGLVDQVTVRDNRQLLQTSTVVVVPALDALRRTENTRIFQGKTTLEIVEALLERGLARYGRAIDASAVDASRLVPRDYCVQYRESDLDFVHRLLEEDGLGYYFVHDHADDGPERLVLFDDNRALERTPTIDGGPVRFDPVSRNWTEWEPILRFLPSVRRTSTSVTARDHDWTRAMAPDIDRTQPIASERSRGEHEVYEHGLERHLIIREDAAVAASLFATLAAAALPRGEPVGLAHQVQSLAGAALGSFTSSNVVDRTQIRAQALSRDAKTSEGLGLVRTFSPGHRFELIGHPTLGADGEYFVTNVVHSSSVIDALMDDAPGGFGQLNYHNRFECLPFETAWRPDRVTPKPRIHGVQTATVTGPVGTDVYTEPYGRIKVRFPWDRDQPDLDGSHTCWMRVSQIWAGAGSPGFMFIPRVGMEVIVSFIDGDPDRPLVMGCVYNGRNPTPGLLPIQATKSFIRTRTVPHGSGHNEISFEDAMGLERVHIRAQRDLDELVMHNHVTDVRASQSNFVGHDQHETIGRNQQLDVRGQRQLTVIGAHIESSLSDHHHHVNGGETVTVGHSYRLDVEGGSYAVEVEHGECSIRAGGPIFVEQADDHTILISSDPDEKGITIKSKESVVHISEDEIELKIGGSSILMTSDLIQINGKTFPAIRISSG